MGFGLFGKLPQKRDFVAHGLPRTVLEPYETWLQSAVAASRNELGAGWQDQYLVAPIWRFWIGRLVFGTECAGAVMPSVDGVGRFFPLTILWSAEAGQALAPPPFDARDEWYFAIEQRLLTVLDPEAAIEVDRLTEGLPEPDLAGSAPAPAGREHKRGTVWQGGEGASALLASIVAPDYHALCEGRSFWWRDGEAATVYARGAMPDPFFFASMITGNAA